jgi:hypothetical protein
LLSKNDKKFFSVRKINILRTNLIEIHTLSLVGSMKREFASQTEFGSKRSKLATFGKLAYELPSAPFCDLPALARYQFRSPPPHERPQRTPEFVFPANRFCTLPDGRVIIFADPNYMIPPDVVAVRDLTTFGNTRLMSFQAGLAQKPFVADVPLRSRF